MRHRKHTFKIGRSGAHRRALLANQVCSLIFHGQLRTTVTKAKETRRIAERMVTVAKVGDLHRRRLAVARLGDRSAVNALFAEIAPRFASRQGGYTRIIRLGQRQGDGAEMCMLQWVDVESPSAEKAESKASKKSKVKATETEAKSE